MSSELIDHVARAQGYIDAVLSRAQSTCKYVRQACQRQLDDLERYADGSEFCFDEEAANRVCRFVACLPHIKGPKANERRRFELEPWQCFLLTTLFGWRRVDTGGRRFKRAYVEVPRGNGKSFLAAAIGIYGLAADGEQGAEVYVAATTSDQSDVVYSTARAMLKGSPRLIGALGIEFTKDTILQPKTNSVFRALSGRASTQDGANIHVGIIDELHAHRTREMYDVLETATSKRLSSLLFIITTAGTDTSGVCYRSRGYNLQVLAGEAKDEAQFGLIYTLDDEKDWINPEAWAAANPNWGVSVIPDVYASMAAKAMQLPADQNAFKTKHLNLWCNADQAWMDMRAWDRCADPSLKAEDFAKDECWFGLDLASKVDIAAKAKLFVRHLPTGKEGSLEAHFFLFLDCYLPDAAVSDGRNASYAGWKAEGRLYVTPGDVTDFGTIREDVLGDCERLSVREVAVDPWQAVQLIQELNARFLEDGRETKCVEVRPLVQHFSEPMKTMDALVRTGHLHHDGNAVLRWMVSNTVCHTDAKDNVYPRKERNEAKIDGVIATLLALSRALRAIAEVPAEGPSIRFL